MKILHTADWHLGKSLEGRDRQKEQIDVLDEICQIADDEKVNLVLVAGDIYQTVNPPAWAENLFYETIYRLSNNGKRGVVVISGNHDQPERIRAANPLADKQGIYLIGLPTDEIRPSQYKKEDFIFTESSGIGWLKIYIPAVDKPIIISALPYPSESRLKLLLSESVNIRDIRQAYSEFIYKWFKSQESIFTKDTYNLAMSHIFVQGGITSESEIEIQIGGAYTVEPKHIPDFFDYVALGHLHRSQEVKGVNSLTKYSGSPLAYSFSEANHNKAITIIDIDSSKCVATSEVHLYSGKPLISKKIINGIPELESWIANEGNIAAWIDLELHLKNPLSLEEINRIRKMHDGLINIRLVTPELEKSLEIINIKSKKPAELFEKFYEYKAGAKPRSEVVTLFTDLFYEQSSEEVDSE